MQSTNVCDSGSAEAKLVVLEATERLLWNSPLSEISVKRICEEAHISRSAFYQHFNDKYDVGKWHYDLICSQHVDNVGTLGYRQANVAMLNSFSQYRSYYRYAFAEQGEHSLAEYAVRKREQRLAEIVFREKGVPYDAVLSYQISAFNAAAVKAVISWIMQDMPLPASRIAELLESILPDNVRRALGRPTNECN